MLGSFVDVPDLYAEVNFHSADDDLNIGYWELHSQGLKCYQCPPKCSIKIFLYAEEDFFTQVERRDKKK